jgi:SHS2 domain-containing protein
MFRWVDHTSELELEIEAPSEESIFAEGLSAVADLAGDADGPPVTREIEVEADDRALLLVEWLSELIYLSETEELVPERIESLRLVDGRLRATIEARRGRARHLVKAVTLHRLEVGPDADGGWRARVVLDV